MPYWQPMTKWTIALALLITGCATQQGFSDGLAQWHGKSIAEYMTANAQSPVSTHKDGEAIVYTFSSTRQSGALYGQLGAMNTLYCNWAFYTTNRIIEGHTYNGNACRD